MRACQMFPFLAWRYFQFKLYIYVSTLEIGLLLKLETQFFYLMQLVIIGKC